MAQQKLNDPTHRFQYLRKALFPAMRSVDNAATGRLWCNWLQGHLNMRILMFCLFVVPAMCADSVAGLQWTAPAGWTNVGTAPMRAATYKVPLAPGDHDVAECVVYFFGQGQGGPVDANMERWNGQFQTPAGKPAAAQIRKRTVHGLPVTTIDVSGAYTGMAGPQAQSAPAPGYRLLGAILENPGGNVFLKFTGPARTVTANQADFEKLLTSFQKKH